MPEKYGSHEKATLVVLALENGEEVPNANLKKLHGIELTPAGREKLNKAKLIRTDKEKGRLIHRITSKGLKWCEDELKEAEPPARSGPLVRVMFEVLRRLARQHGVHLADLESLIRRAYEELSRKPQDWVRLADLRDNLDGATKDEVDEVLRAMARTGLVHLTPDSDRKALTDADHAAAIRIGKEDKHLVAIEES